VFPDD
jgi:hypothetical protein